MELLGGIVIGVIGTIGAEIGLLYVAGRMVDRKHQPPTKEEWKVLE